MISIEPAYIKTHRAGLLQSKIAAAYDIMLSCEICPHLCRVDRRHGELGLCRTGDKPVVASFGPHFGEEDPLVGQHGSGTIFFSHCNLFCSFCQNWEISHGGEGEEIEVEDLAAIMLRLQAQGCHNINFVTPSHQVPMILAALPHAIAGGLRLPLVYNTGGYDSLATLRFLDGIMDIYMPDFKFWDEKVAAALCNAPDYPEMARQAVKEMHRQVGDLVLDEPGVALPGAPGAAPGLAGRAGRHQRNHALSGPGNFPPDLCECHGAIPALRPGSSTPFFSQIFIRSGASGSPEAGLGGWLNPAGPERQALPLTLKRGKGRQCHCWPGMPGMKEKMKPIFFI